MLISKNKSVGESTSGVTKKFVGEKIDCCDC